MLKIMKKIRVEKIVEHVMEYRKKNKKALSKSEISLIY